MEKNPRMFIKNPFLFDSRKKDMGILDDMGVSKFQKRFFLKVNYSFKSVGNDRQQ